MTIRKLINELQQIAADHGDQIQVLVVDEDDLWPFGVFVHVPDPDDDDPFWVALDLTAPDHT